VRGQTARNVAERARVLRSAGVVAAITMISRVAGYARDVVFTYFFGTGLYADAFVAAFRLPNILRRLVGEGNVSAAFVPVFEHESVQRPEEELWRLADSFHAAIAAVAGLLTAAGMLLAPFLVRYVLIPGNPDAWQLTRRLVWMTFPYLIFIAAASALMAILNARDRFAAAAFSPVLLNLTMIGSAAFMLRAEAPILIWAGAAVVGGFLQWASLVPHAGRLGMRFWPRAGLADPALRRIGRLMLPGIVGVGVTQINTLVGQLLASYLVLGSISSLFLAGRVTELPLGVFAIAIATVVLPLMSRQAAAGDRSEMIDTLGFALRQTAFITLPATAGLLVLRLEIVSVLFERGAFGPVSAARTASALAGYSLGLIAFAGVRVVAPGFFALRDTRTPVLIAAVAMIANLIGCLAFMPLLGHTGIAIAGSLAAFVNAALLIGGLRRKVGRIGGWRLVASFARLGGAAAVMAWVVWGVRDGWLSSFAVGNPARIAALAATVALGALTYLAAAAILRAPELGELRSWRSRVAP